MNIKICHLTTVHNRYDIRIYKKMCISLSQRYQSVNLIVADGLGDEILNRINLYDIGKPSGRLNRMVKAPKLLFEKALWVNADIYHFHDPELIPVGRKLLKRNKVVIMDAHEDFPKQLLGKPYMNKLAKISLSTFFSIYESWACKKFDAIVAATKSIAEKFIQINKEVVVINNYPIINELSSHNVGSVKSRNVCYIGAISQIRGIKEVVEALEYTKNLDLLVLAGKFNDERLENEVKNLRGWKKVQYLGDVNREKVKDILASSVAGLVTFLSQANHLEAQPNKMFEYMSAGIPVIGSDFPLWKEIIEGENCGICVNPSRPQEIAEAIDHLIAYPEQAQQKGSNGRRSIKERYNWSIEERKLLMLYDQLQEHCYLNKS